MQFRNEVSTIRGLYRHCKTQHFVDNKGILRSVSPILSFDQGREQQELQKRTGYALEEQALSTSVETIQGPANEVLLQAPTTPRSVVHSRLPGTIQQQSPLANGQSLQNTLSHNTYGQSPAFMQTGAEQTSALLWKERPLPPVSHEVIEQVVAEELNNQLSKGQPPIPNVQSANSMHYTPASSNEIMQHAIQPSLGVVPTTPQSMSSFHAEISQGQGGHVSTHPPMYSQQQHSNFVSQPLIGHNFESNPTDLTSVPQTHQFSYEHNNRVHAQRSVPNTNSIGTPEHRIISSQPLPPSNNSGSVTCPTNTLCQTTEPRTTIGVPYKDLAPAHSVNSTTTPLSEASHPVTNTLTPSAFTVHAHAPYTSVHRPLLVNQGHRPMASSSERPAQKVSSDATRSVQKAGSNPRTTRAPPLPSNVVTRRCEITKSVRDVAEKMQESLFKGCGLYFVSATFQVPTTVEEAFNIMKTGTHDFDKSDDNAPASELYLASWAHTQFFAAQMAALGFRFVTCNLRKSGVTVKPPAVDEWLHLSRYDMTKPSSGSVPAETIVANDETRNQPVPTLAPSNIETGVALLSGNSNTINAETLNTANVIGATDISTSKPPPAPHFNNTDTGQQNACAIPDSRSEGLPIDKSQTTMATMPGASSQLTTHGLNPQPLGSPEVIDLT